MGKIAFLFSGQGAQYSGMGKELYESNPAARAVFTEAERQRPGTINQCFYGTKEELSQTINTQPCLFAVDLACAAALDDAGIKAEGAAGFSLGEVAALAYCSMLTFEEGFKLVQKRAEVMDACARKYKGIMAAVLKLPDAVTENLCKEAGAWPVNYNCPGQLVAAGTVEAVDRLSELVTQKGGRVMKLPVSGAFHSPFMKEASAALLSYISELDLKQSRIPLYSNVTALPYEKNAGGLLSKQASSPVLWRETIWNMISDGFDTFVEVGAGKTLSGLVRRISEKVSVYNVENPADLNAVKQALIGG
ncbi:MAG: ACP S-malonyltransferase [Bacillota bacterium]|nr:ACP S-malonyltransferase [Bacillota bacterium]